MSSGKLAPFLEFFILSMRLYPLRFVLIVVLLSGCSHNPTVPENQVATLKPWQSATPDQVQQGEANPKVLSQWWQQWQDPVLNELLATLLKHNPSLASSGISYQIALLQAGVATSSLRPKATLSLGASESFTEKANTSNFNAGANVSWEFDLWGKHSAYKNKAEAAALRAQEDVHAAQVSLMAQAVQSYLNLRVAQQQQAYARDLVALKEQDLAMQKWLQHSGLATDIEVSKSLTALRQAQAQLPSYDKTIWLALQQLRMLSGDELTSLMPQLQQSAQLPKEALLKVSLNAELLRQRPDVKAQELAIVEQHEAVFLAKRARVPSFTLTGSISSSSADIGDLFSVQSIVSRIAANLAYVLFDGGSLKQAVEVQKLQLEKSLLDYQKTLLTAQQEVEGALTSLDVSQQRQISYNQALESAQLSLDLAQAQYDAGLVGLNAVLDAKAALLNSQNAVLTSHAEVLASWVQLYRSLGGGWQDLALPVAQQ